MSIVETMYTGISDFKDIKQTTTYSFWTNNTQRKEIKMKNVIYPINILYLKLKKQSFKSDDSFF